MRNDYAHVCIASNDRRLQEYQEVCFMSWYIWTWWYICHSYKKLICKTIKFYCNEEHHWDKCIKQYFKLCKLTCSFIVTEIYWPRQSRFRPGHNNSFAFESSVKCILWIKKVPFSLGLVEEMKGLSSDNFMLIHIGYRLEKLHTDITKTLHICK